MKSAEIKDISIKDLQERIETEKAQLGKLKVQHAVSPVENPSIIKKNRRDIARMLPITTKFIVRRDYVETTI